MKIWIVIGWNWEDSYLVGAFSSLEKAENIQKKYDFVSIEEFEIDSVSDEALGYLKNDDRNEEKPGG